MAVGLTVTDCTSKLPEQVPDIGEQGVAGQLEARITQTPAFGKGKKVFFGPLCVLDPHVYNPLAGTYYIIQVLVRRC